MYTTKDIANKFNINLEGDSTIKIQGVCGISDNLPNHISFITNEAMIQNAEKSEIPVFVCNSKLKLKNKTALIHEEPDLFLQRLPICLKKVA